MHTLAKVVSQNKSSGRSRKPGRSPTPDVFPPDSFCCPISREIMSDPVVTYDGQTYERKEIQEWFDRGNNTSPITNLQLKYLTLAPNHALRNAIQDWMKPTKTDALCSSTFTAPASVQTLAKIFHGLDPIREQLDSVLDGCQPPMVVAFGGESDGKSSILERIAMVPIFPKGKTMCTRLPILINLRNVETNQQPCLQVMKRSKNGFSDSDTVVGGPGLFALPVVFNGPEDEITRFVCPNSSGAFYRNSQDIDDRYEDMNMSYNESIMGKLVSENWIEVDVPDVGLKYLPITQDDLVLMMRADVTGDYSEIIRTTMLGVIRKENEKEVGISAKTYLKLSLGGPHLPNLDLLDLPGLVLNARDDEPKSMQADTHRLVDSIISETHGRAVYLAVRKITDDFRSSQTMSVLKRNKQIVPKTIVVYTHCDESNEKKIRERMNENDLPDLCHG